MELQFLSISALFAFLLFLFMVLKTVKRSNAKNSTLKLPPGPCQLPLIGNLHHLLGSLPHRTLTDLAKKYGPLMYLRLGQVSTIVVSSPEIAKEVMKTHDIIFAQRPYLLASRIISYDSTNIAFSPYGDYWRQLRKICILELLSTKRVQTFRSINEEEVLNLIKEISSNKRSTINLSKKIYSLTYGITARAAFGKKSKDQEEFISLVKTVLELLAGFSIADMYPSIKLLEVISGVRPRLEKTHEKIDKILENIVNEHKERKTTTKAGEGEVEDLVDVLLRVQRHGDLEFPLTDNNIKAVILDIFSAGSDTSSTAVEWTMLEMLKNPQVMERAQTEVREVFNDRSNFDETGLRSNPVHKVPALVGSGRGRCRQALPPNFDETGLNELKYLKSVIKETLRLHPPVPLLLPRESSEQCEINGYMIPAKTKVIINAWTISRDPGYWLDAETFDPSRFLDSSIDYKGTDFEYIPFGAGRRICPGISFALANIELPLAQLLYHFDWELPNGLKREELDMTETFGLTVKRKKDLYLIPIPYHPSPLE